MLLPRENTSRRMAIVLCSTTKQDIREEGGGGKPRSDCGTTGLNWGASSVASKESRGKNSEADANSKEGRILSHLKEKFKTAEGENPISW